MSQFDEISKAAFSVVTQIMGDAAIWFPSDGTNQVPGKVLLKDISEKSQLGDVEKFDYMPYNHSFEYYYGTFSDLKQSVDSGNIETVTINGIYFDVKRVDAKVDGRTFIAYCDLKVPQTSAIIG